MTIFSWIGQNIGRPFEWLGRSAVRGWNQFGEFYGGINKKIKQGLEYVEVGALGTVKPNRKRTKR